MIGNNEKLRQTVLRALKAIHLSLNDSTLDSLIQFVKFGAVGLTNTILSYGLNVLTLVLLKPFRLSWDYLAANVVAFVLSVLWSFFWNNRFVFTTETEQKRNMWKALARTYIAYSITGILLNNALSYLWINQVGLSKFVAPILNLLISVPLNFILNKYWAFKKR